MRLTDHERRTLVDSIAAADPQAQIWLHGSRVRDDACGGDLDLLVLSQHLGLRDKIDLLARLHQVLGEQKIDLELESPGSLLDRLRRAEKRGWVDTDGEFVRIRELRNLIAHEYEYEDEDLAELYREVLRHASKLLAAVPQVVAWAGQVR